MNIFLLKANASDLLDSLISHEKEKKMKKLDFKKVLIGSIMASIISAMPTLAVYGQTKSGAAKDVADVAQETAYDMVFIGRVQYALRVVSVSMNKKGNIVVKTDGNAVGKACKYWQIASEDGRFFNIMPPLGVEIVAGGKLVNATGFKVEDDGIVSEFPTKIKPEKITIFYIGDKKLQVSFNGKTKMLIKE